MHQGFTQKHKQDMHTSISQSHIDLKSPLTVHYGQIRKLGIEIRQFISPDCLWQTTGNNPATPCTMSPLLWINYADDNFFPMVKWSITHQPLMLLILVWPFPNLIHPGPSCGSLTGRSMNALLFPSNVEKDLWHNLQGKWIRFTDTCMLSLWHPNTSVTFLVFLLLRGRLYRYA